MPPRLNKRQQREQEELEALAGPSIPRAHDESSEDEAILRKGVPNSRVVVGFAALADDGDEQETIPVGDGDDPVQSTKSKKSKKKKKKGTGVSAVDTHAEPVKSAKSKSKVREVPKSKGKLKADDEDFEKALAELSGRFSASHLSESAKATSASQSSFDAFFSLLSVSLKHLDPETELRRFFGSKVITASGSSRHPRVRSYLARPQPAWPPAQYRAGLSMRALTAEEVKEKGTGVGPDTRERWWTAEASPRYKGTTYEYLQCVMGGDPQLFYNLMYEMPWHADTLLQMAEVFRHREEFSTAADFTSRALFAYERAFGAAFNLATGIHRLDFDRVENRVFYLALARHMIDLKRRGTPRTAFEFARLLYALDPHTDPHGALLHLDSLAIKAGQADWLLGLWDAYLGMDLGKGGEARFDVTIMPGWCWTRALALFDKEGDADDEHLKSTQALRDAIISFPSIAPLLADKLDVAMSAELRKMDAFKITTDYSVYRDDLSTSLIHLLSHIYVLRSFSLWKPPARAAWFLRTLNSLSPSSFTPSIPPLPRRRIQSLFASYSNVTDAIYRHIVVAAPLVSEFGRLTAFFPGEVKARLTQTIEGDPLPPVTAVSAYEDGYFLEAGVDNRGGVLRNAGERMAEHLMRAIPNPVERGQLQALFDAHPEIAARFPGGMVEIAQLARQFPQEVLEAVLGMVGADQQDDGDVEAAGGDPAGNAGRVPGGEGVLGLAVGEEGGEAEVGAAEGENEHRDEPFFPVRIMQNLLGRLWGRDTEGVEANSASGSGSDSEAERQNPQHHGPRADDVD